MTTPAAPGPLTDDALRRLSPLRRFLIRNVGCVFALVAGAAFLLAFGLWIGVGIASENLLLRLSLGSAPGDSLVIANFGSELGALIFAAFVTFVAIPGLLAQARSRVTFGAGLVVLLAAAGWFFWYDAYRDFVAIGRRGHELVLVHLWPRPNTTLDARTVTGTEVDVTIALVAGGPTDCFALAIEASGGAYTSRCRIHGQLIEQARQVVLEAQAGGSPAAEGARRR